MAKKERKICSLLYTLDSIATASKIDDKCTNASKEIKIDIAKKLIS